MLDKLIIVAFMICVSKILFIVSTNMANPITYGNSTKVCPIAIMSPFFLPPQSPSSIAVVVSGPGLSAPLSDITMTDSMTSIMVV